MAKTNKEILNAIRNEASAEYQERVPEVKTSEDMERVLRAYEGYPSARNEFINALTSKIFKSVVMNKVWNNPLVMLKKGEVPYGQGIEQLFVEMAKKKDFNSYFGKGNVESSLLAREDADVKQRFIQKNFAYKYKVSLSNQRLRSAFSSENGVANLIDGLVASVMTAANNEEFQDMLKILNRSQDVVYSNSDGSGYDTTNTKEGTFGLGKIEKGIIHRISELDGTRNSNKHSGILQIVGTQGVVDEKLLVEKVRTYASEMSFLSDKYNLAGVKTACQPEDLVLFTTSEMVAKIDVHVIAAAFNVSATDVNVRIIKVPNSAFENIDGKKWGTSGVINNVKPVAVLCDKDAIQQYDTLVDSGSFYNPDQLMTNMFVHRQGITASCDFAQTIVFGVKAGS